MKYFYYFKLLFKFKRISLNYKNNKIKNKINYLYIFIFSINHKKIIYKNKSINPYNKIIPK